MANVVFKCGERFGVADDEKSTAWDRRAESRHELMKRALLWSDWPESDTPYAGVVWVEDANGDVLEREDVTIREDGELDFG